jgi:hypothetical protein
MSTLYIFNQKSGIMRSSTFQDPHPQNRCRALGSGTKTPLLTMLTVFFMALFMQVGNLQAQNLYATCTGCTASDVKVAQPFFDPGPNATCLEADFFTGVLKVNLSITASTRYGLYLEYDLYVNGAQFGNRITYCVAQDLPKGTYPITISDVITNIPANSDIQLKNVFTAWDNQRTSQTGSYFCVTLPILCENIDKPRCRTYAELEIFRAQGKPEVLINTDGPVCQGTDAEFTLTGPNSTTGITYTLHYRINGGAWVEVPNFNGSYDVPAVSTANGFDVTIDAYLVRNKDGVPVCTGDTESDKIVVNDAASVVDIPVQTVCAGSNIILSVTSTPATGSWLGGADGQFTLNGRTTPGATYNPSNAEEMAQLTSVLTWRTSDPDGAGPCPYAEKSVQHILRAPATAEAGESMPVCESATPSAITLTGATIGGYGVTTGTWAITSPNPAVGTLSNYNATANPAAVTYTPAANWSGTVTLTLTTNNPEGPCNAASDTRTITVNQKSTANAGREQTICADQKAQLGATSSPATGSWSGSNGTYTSATNINPANTDPNAMYEPSVADKTAGFVVLTWTTTDPDGTGGPCTAASSTVRINLQALPIANAGLPKTTCVGEAVSISGSVTGGPYTSIMWKAPMNSGSFGNASSLNTTFTPSITGDITLTLEVTPTAPCVTKVTSTVVITSEKCDGVGFCTYTQGYFGQDVGNGRAHYLVGDVCTTTQAAGTITAALKGWGNGGMNLSMMNFKWNVPADVAKIAEYLPGGGPAAAYTGTKEALSAKNPKNILLAQTMTLGLNMGLNPTLKNFTLQTGMLYTIPSDDCGVNGSGEGECFPFDVDGLPNLNGVPGIQVQDVWMAANLALKGDPSAASWSKSKLAGAAGSVNEAFDECRVERGWDRRECYIDRNKVNPESLLLTESFTVANNGAAKNLTVKAFPNPFKDRVTIQFTSPVSGKAIVEIFDMTGRRLEMINKGQVIAGRMNTVDYTVPATNRNSIIYKVTVDKFSVNGRLVSPGK